MSQEEHETVENSDLENEESEAQEEASSESVQENELEALKVALAQSEDRYQRVHADFENIRKRLEKEKYQALEYSNEKFAKELIPVVDSLSMAIAATKSDMDANELLQKLEEGVELTMKQFLSVLEKHGITPVSEDEPFDPNIHHAVQQIDSPDHESGDIVSTFQKGYRYKDRTLRDAMVIIAN
ncbi:MAG: nucleotide exchange factor GrpE [Campylobacterales bacterium]|nr:nucleotide exchange factor GrpE [Campylobacterales bacterium]MBE0499518.1 nucleotide exchange factor GrpE [Campylobacterales bacterium]